ncbi:tetratricopeptide repeat protein [Alteromonas flava]|uniref:tetratricopeptide repeat protein n=1 Tax=Alteromonas flava TaxID=2048003 RepID=UPI000C28324D|nr:tetratricopeptide repeat protein [Alteromonas flava]
MKWFGLLCTCLLVGCSSYQANVVYAPANKVVRDNQTRANALANLTLSPVTASASKLDNVPLIELREQYQALVPLVDELTRKPLTELGWHGVLGQDIRNRLADIEMLLAEDAQAQGIENVSGNYYAVAIAAYEALLANERAQTEPLTPLAKENILYQLARAYSLQGDDQRAVSYAQQLLKRYPYSLYASELYFRIGEYHYNNNNYRAAIEAYEEVLKGRYNSIMAKQQDPFYAMSAYMNGWSHFKRESYAKAIDAFMLMLDVSLAAESYAQAHKPLDDLNLSELRLVEDALSMTGLMFLSEGGVMAINGYFALFGEKPYTYLVYDSLAQQLLDDSRYRESAAMYLAFAEQYPMHTEAIPAFVKHIDVFIIGEFPTDVLPAKQRFVEAYGMNGPYWQGFTAAQAEQAMPYLDEYIATLAQHEHALAQQTEASIQDLPASAGNSRQLLAQMRDYAYQQAQRWYKEYIQTFSPSGKAADIQFYLAESYYQAGDLSAAITEYEQFAYTYVEHEQAVNAAYSALTARDKLAVSADNLPAQTLADYQASQVKFLQTFPQDERANSVAVTLMQSLYDAEVYPAAVEWSQWLLARPISAETREVAQLVLAQSQFEIQDFAGAEQSYQQLLAILPANSPIRADMTDKLAATYFQQARQILAQSPDHDPKGAVTPQRANALRAAIERLLLVVAQTSNSAIAINAEYDVISYLMRLTDWPAAITQMLAFEQKYPQHDFTKDIPERLIVAYENTGQWLLAAQRLEAIWQAQPDTDKGREALYLAAEYADRADDISVALPLFRTYAHTYPLPLAAANEARYTLSNYYLDSDEPSKRRFWLNKLVQAHAEAGTNGTDRSRYLAAMAQTVFAEDQFFAFQKIKLTLPLDKSIQQKRSAMQAVIDSYQQVLQYRIAEFSTQAGYRLAAANEALAQALYASERPPELDALALEQYEFLLEEQAFPFEEQAIAIHEQNTQRSWQGNYDDWVSKSYAALARLLPARFDKPEQFRQVNYAEF